jgi:transposase-like protein
MKKREPNSSAQPTKLIRHKYDEEFKKQALAMVRNGQSVRSAAQALGISE